MGVIEARRRILLNAPHVEATTPAGVANFTTDLISPLRSLKAGFLPVQSGSGDPSPSNVRPISGWSGLTLYKASENLFDSSVPTVPGRLASDGTIEANNNYVTTDFIPIDSGNYTFCVCSSYDGSGTIATRIFAYDSNKEAIGHSLWQLRTSDDKYFTATFTIGTAKYIKLSYRITDFDIAIYSTNSITTIPVTFPAAGKNLFDQSTLSDASAYSDTYNYYWYTKPIHLQPNTAYTLSPSSSPALTLTLYYVLYLNSSEDDPNYLSGGSNIFRYPVTTGRPQTIQFTTGPTGTIRFGVSDGNKAQCLAEIMSVNWQLELGSTATSYEPYRNAYYGGYVDLVRGVVVAESIGVTTTWGEIKADIDQTTGYQWGYVPIEHPILTNGKGASSTNSFCNIGKMYWDGPSSAIPHFYLVYQSLYDRYRANVIQHEDTPDSTVVQVVAKLITPITYPLTPQVIKSLRGTNNIWSDANGDMSVEYWKH